MDPRLAALGVLLALSPWAPAAGREFRGKPFDLAEPPHSQLGGSLVTVESVSPDGTRRAAQRREPPPARIVVGA